MFMLQGNICFFHSIPIINLESIGGKKCINKLVLIENLVLNNGIAGHEIKTQPIPSGTQMTKSDKRIPVNSMWVHFLFLPSSLAFCQSSTKIINSGRVIQNSVISYVHLPHISQVNIPFIKKKPNYKQKLPQHHLSFGTNKKQKYHPSLNSA